LISVKKFTFNSFYENTYVVWDNDSKEAMVVDPGCSDSFEEKELERFINQNKLKLKYIVNTHCHIDHIFGVTFLKEKYKVPYYAPEKDVPLLQYVEKQAEAVGISFNKASLPDHFLTEDMELFLGNTKPAILFTPGHTPGEYCIYFPEDKFCITGDVLFLESIGRTDLWGGDYDTLIHSIKNKLFVLPDETKIYPGHGENSSIGNEKRNNPFLTGIL
jgi:hydroxyacylglutathione hydrolase